MTPAAVILTVAVYIAVLFVVAYLSGRKADNAGFFTGNRRTPWYMAALAMIGAAISGVTFISVPGSVAADSFSYMQMVLGFTVGQMVVAFVLIPLFYKMKVVSLYEYLDDRFGVGSHRTGAWFFGDCARRMHLVMYDAEYRRIKNVMDKHCKQEGYKVIPVNEGGIESILRIKEVLDRRLKVMDLTAFTLCRENGLGIIVFDMDTPGNLGKVLAGEQIGTLVTGLS